jgi:putative aldouronate transport system substrate-binding protein
VFRAPNNWRLGSNGGLVKDIETEEYKAALVFLRSLIEAGYVSPDVKTNVDLNNDIFSSKIAMRANAWNSYQGLLVDNAAKFNETFRVVPPFGHDGKAGTNLLGPGNFGWTAVKKASPDRVKELLRVFNYLAAPFGSEEFMVTTYGAKGQDWAPDDKGNPKLTPDGAANMAGTPATVWNRLTGSPHWLFSSAVPEYARFGSEDETRLLEAGVADPTLGQYSPTDARKGSQLSRLIFDRVSSIAAGRNPISDLDQLVKDWRAQGGDDIRGEYEKAIAG